MPKASSWSSMLCLTKARGTLSQSTECLLITVVRARIYLILLLVLSRKHLDVTLTDVSLNIQSKRDGNSHPYLISTNLYFCLHLAVFG